MEKGRYLWMLQIAITLLLCNTWVFNAQAPLIQWQKSFGGSNQDSANYVIQTTDGGYIFTGSSNSNNGDVSGNHGDFDIWVGKISPSGSLEWQKSLGGGGTEWSRNIQQTQDGGYIIAGRSNMNGGDVTGNHGNYDFWVVKLNANGIIQWQKSLGGSSHDDAFFVIETSDNGFIIVGSSLSIDGDVTASHAQDNVWVVKTNAVGIIEWQKTYGGSNNEIAKHIEPTSDGGYILTGYSDSNDGDLTFNNGGLDVWVFKIDSIGNIIWQKSYGGSENEVGECIKQTSDGGYVFVGSTLSNDGDVSGNNGFVDGWLVKISATGDLMWQRALGGSDIDTIEEIQLTPNGGFVVIGASQSNNGNVIGNHGLFDYWTAFLNSDRIIVWQRPFGGSQSDYGNSLKSTSDGGYIVAGYSESNNGDVSGNHGVQDSWIFKLAPDPLLVTELENIACVLFPNPVTDQLHLEATIPIDRIIIYTPLGQMVYDRAQNGNSVTVSTDGFCDGLYLVEVHSANNSNTYKILKQD